MSFTKLYRYKTPKRDITGYLRHNINAYFCSQTQAHINESLNNNDFDNEYLKKKQKERKKKTKVYSWGWGCHGQLGHGDYGDRIEPTYIEGLEGLDIAQVSSGWVHSLVLTTDGNVYVFGWTQGCIKTMHSCANLKINFPQALKFYQRAAQSMKLGFLGYDNGQLYPSIVSELKGMDIIKVKAGAQTSYALSRTGEVYSWGTGRWGQLGHKIYNHYTEEFPRPQVIERLLGHHIVDIDPGYAHTLFLDNTGCVWVCGPGLNGRLGMGIGSSLGEYPIPRPLTPIWKNALQQQWHKKICKFINNGMSNEYEYQGLKYIDNNGLKFIDKDNSEFDNIKYIDDKELNTHMTNDDYLIPYKSIHGSSPYQVNGFSDDNNDSLSSVNKTPDMTYYYNYDYQSYLYEFGIEPPLDPNVLKISAGHKHSMLLLDNGNVYTFGAGLMGALGHGRDFFDKHWPTKVELLSDKFIIDIECGENHNVVLTDDNEIYTFGMSRHGQCGRNRNEAFMLQDVRERGSDLTTIEHRPPYPIIDDKNDIYKDPDDGILIKGDPLAMSVGKIYIPKKYKPKKILAGHYETTIITECGKAIIYGADSERLENNPKPKIVTLPGKIVQMSHGWKHSMALCLEE